VRPFLEGLLGNSAEFFARLAGLIADGGRIIVLETNIELERGSGVERAAHDEAFTEEMNNQQGLWQRETGYLNEAGGLLSESAGPQGPGTYLESKVHIYKKPGPDEPFFESPRLPSVRDVAVSFFITASIFKWFAGHRGGSEVTAGFTNAPGGWLSIGIFVALMTMGLLIKTILGRRDARSKTVEKPRGTLASMDHRGISRPGNPTPLPNGVLSNLAPIRPSPIQILPPTVWLARRSA
jgi:hypothetical protein